MKKITSFLLISLMLVLALAACGGETDVSGAVTAVLGAVFLKRYGGDAALASALLLVATGISCVTLLGVFAFVG